MVVKATDDGVRTEGADRHDGGAEAAGCEDKGSVEEGLQPGDHRQLHQILPHWLLETYNLIYNLNHNR